MKQLLGFYEWHTWHSFPVTFHTVEEEEMRVLIETKEIKIYTSPLKHFIPTIGMRFEFIKSGKVIAFSSDSAPTPNLISLAKDADVLIHEAAGTSPGHSSALQAGEIASEANVKSLYLRHALEIAKFQITLELACEKSSGKVKLKLRTTKYLYTLVVKPQKAEEILQRVKCQIVEARAVSEDA